jgi:hypothetical protein
MEGQDGKVADYCNFLRSRRYVANTIFVKKVIGAFVDQPSRWSKATICNVELICFCETPFEIIFFLFGRELAPRLMLKSVPSYLVPAADNVSDNFRVRLPDGPGGFGQIVVETEVGFFS